MPWPCSEVSSFGKPSAAWIRLYVSPLRPGGIRPFSFLLVAVLELWRVRVYKGMDCRVVTSFLQHRYLSTRHTSPDQFDRPLRPHIHTHAHTYNQTDKWQPHPKHHKPASRTTSAQTTGSATATNTVYVFLTQAQIPYTIHANILLNSNQLQDAASSPVSKTSSTTTSTTAGHGGSRVMRRLDFWDRFGLGMSFSTLLCWLLVMTGANSFVGFLGRRNDLQIYWLSWFLALGRFCIAAISLGN